MQKVMNFKTSNMIKLSNTKTVLLDGFQAEITGNYKLVGQVSGTSNKYIVRCADTGALHIVELNVIHVI
jgi:hypothetical protein